jgi:predicted nucleic acid-binding protein
MFLVIDANILFSFFNPSSARRVLIHASPKLGFKLISADFVFEELAEDRGKIQKYAGISGLEFILFFSLLEKMIESVPKEEHDNFLSNAMELAPHAKDVPYFALALSLNCPIWSDEKAFRKQSKVKVYSTSELLKRLKL